MPYQSTWNNPYLPQSNYTTTNNSYLPQSGYTPPLGQSYTYQQPVNGIVKVNGPQSAMQVQLPPNSTSQPLIDASFDGKKGMMYVVSTDGTGTKSLEWYDFTVHEEEKSVVVDGVEFASKKELDELAAKVGVIMEVLHGSNAAVPATANADAIADVPAPLNPAGGHLGDGPAARAE